METIGLGLLLLMLFGLLLALGLAIVGLTLIIGLIIKDLKEQGEGGEKSLI